MISRLFPKQNLLQRILLLSTFLGVVIHEYAHKETTTVLGYQVHEVCYFQLDNPAGYVKHDLPKSYTHTFAISAAPFILNTMVGYTAMITAGLYAVDSGLTMPNDIGVVVFFLWVGISSCIHSFPSSQDISNIWTSAKHLYSETRGWIFKPLIYPLKYPYIIISLPLIVLLVTLDKLRILGANYLYTILILASSYHTTSFIALETDLLTIF